MSHSVSLADYRAALTAPGATAPVITSLFARLPIAMIGFSLLLYVQHETGSFAIAGLVSAAALTGVACGSVIQGRVMDRVGPSRPLLTITGVFCACVAAEVAAIEAHASVVALTMLAFGCGATEPQVGPASRTLWGRLLAPGPQRDAAYSYEAISMEIFFILGPGLAGVLVALPWPGTGVVAGASCMVLGSIGFALTRPAWHSRPDRQDRPATSMLGALASPGMRSVVLAAFGFGLLVGFLEVAIPASAHRAGHPTMGGLLLSLLSISSVIVGILYGMRPWPRPMHLRLPALLVGFAVLIATLALPATLLGLCFTLLLVGALITPQSTAHSVALEHAAPSGTATEAFGWVVTAVTLGAAFGQSISGQLVEISGPPLAFFTASAVGSLIGGVLWLRRGTLVPELSKSEVALAQAGEQAG